MKKDIKFLNELGSNLDKIPKKEKNLILEKYRNIINDELKNKKRISDIIKLLGNPVDIAENETKQYNKRNLKNKIKSKIKSKIHITKKSTKKKVNKKENPKKDKNKFKEKKSLKKDKNKKKENNVLNKLKSIYNQIILYIKKIINKKDKSKRSETIEENSLEEVEKSSENIVEMIEERKRETKSSRIIRIICQVVGFIIILIVLFALLWMSMIFTASLFAILDGIKMYGINLLLLSMSLLVLWLLLVLVKIVYRKKIKFKLTIISLILIIILIGISTAIAVKNISNVEIIHDVSSKYSMTTNLQKYKLPSDGSNKHITFNSEYDTNYKIEYDDKLDGEFKLEIKYYESYYDFYVKNSNKEIYVSLALDYRDRLSVYIENLKENVIYDDDELKRYTVRIIVNKKDKDKIIINN